MDPSAQNHKSTKQVWYGIGLTFLLHVLLLIHPPLLVIIGLTQFIYLGPALVWAGVKGKKGLLQGMLIGAGITFLVNVACFGYVMYSFTNY